MRLISSALFVDPAEQQERMKICNACDFKRGNYCGKRIVGEAVEYQLKDGIPKKPTKGRKREGHTCGCFMPLKSRMKSVSCPLGAWGEKDEEQKLVDQARQLMAEVEGKSRISREQADAIQRIYSQLSGHKKERTSCGKCIQTTVKQLETFIAKYE